MKQLTFNSLNNHLSARKTAEEPNLVDTQSFFRFVNHDSEAKKALMPVVEFAIQGLTGVVNNDLNAVKINQQDAEEAEFLANGVTITFNHVDDKGSVVVPNKYIDMYTAAKEGLDELINKARGYNIDGIVSNMVGGLASQLDSDIASMKQKSLSSSTFDPMATAILSKLVPTLFTMSDADVIKQPKKFGYSINKTVDPTSNRSTSFSVNNDIQQIALPGQLIQTLYPHMVTYYMEDFVRKPNLYRDKLLTQVHVPEFDSVIGQISEYIELLANDVPITKGEATLQNTRMFAVNYGEKRRLSSKPVAMSTIALSIGEDKLANPIYRMVFIKSLLNASYKLEMELEREHANYFNQVMTEVEVANGKASAFNMRKLTGIDYDGMPNSSLYINDLRVIVETAKQKYEFNPDIVSTHPYAIAPIFDSFFTEHQGWLPQLGNGDDIYGRDIWSNGQEVSNVLMLDPHINRGQRGFGQTIPDLQTPGMDLLNKGRYFTDGKTRNRSLFYMQKTMWEQYFINIGRTRMEIVPDLTHKLYDTESGYEDVTAQVVNSADMITLGEDLATDIHVYDSTRVGILITTGIRPFSGKVAEFDGKPQIRAYAYDCIEQSYMYPNAMRLVLKNVKVASAYNKEFINVRRMAIV